MCRVKLDLYSGHEKWRGRCQGESGRRGRWRGRKKDSGVLVKVSSLRIACCAIPSSDLLRRLTDEREGAGGGGRARSEGEGGRWR